MALTPPTTITAASLATTLKVAAGTPVEDALQEATGLLESATAETFREIPVAVMDAMVVRVARAAYEGRTRSQYGGSQATQVQGEAVQRPPRDPLEAARPLLSRYVVGMA
jgi:hypothetical protein